MAYTTYQEIDRLLKWFEFSANSKVSITDITTYFIPETDAIINSQLGLTYEVPITDSDDLLVIEYIATRIVACEVANVLILQADGELSPIVQRWCEQAQEKLKMLVTQQLILPNSTLKTTNRLYSFTAHGNSDYDADDLNPIWEIGTIQW